LLEHLDSIIHVHVQKLYPDAMLPVFTTQSKNDKEMAMIYHSPRKMEELALGLLNGCAEHYGVKAEIRKKPLNDGRSGILFTIILLS
jgi:hypothetical protein